MRLRLAVPLLALLLLQTPAQAATWSGGDQRRDVITYDHSPEPEPCGTDTERALPGDAATDITRLAVTHGPRSIRLVVGFRDIDGLVGHGTTIYLRSSAGDHQVEVTRFETWGRVHAMLMEMPDYDALQEQADESECGIVSYGGMSWSCAGFRAQLDPRRDRVVVRLPRTCVGEPRWVRAGAAAYTFDTEDSEAPLHYDRWVPKGAKDTASWDGPYGPRVRVG